MLPCRRLLATAILAIAILLAPWIAAADQVQVATSGAFQEACLRLVPAFERATHHTVVVSFGASMGSGPDTIPRRLARGERLDVVILAGGALEELVKAGSVTPGSTVDLVRSRIGMAVRTGAPRPDISSLDALRRTLLAARSIGYSSSASGQYLVTDLFPRLGIADALKGRLRLSEGAVGPLVASGEAEIGFQQISELLPVPGIEYVGPLPVEAQRETVFSAGLVTTSVAPEAAKALIAFLASRAAAPIIAATGLEPVTPTR